MGSGQQCQSSPQRCLCLSGPLRSGIRPTGSFPSTCAGAPAATAAAGLYSRQCLSSRNSQHTQSISVTPQSVPLGMPACQNALFALGPSFGPKQPPSLGPQQAKAPAPALSPLTASVFQLQNIRDWMWMCISRLTPSCLPCDPPPPGEGPRHQCLVHPPGHHRQGTRHQCCHQPPGNSRDCPRPYCCPYRPPDRRHPRQGARHHRGRQTQWRNNRDRAFRGSDQCGRPQDAAGLMC